MLKRVKEVTSLLVVAASIVSTVPAMAADGTGWSKDEAVWHYLKADGAMATGWQNVGSTWYYLNESGEMQTGWINDKGTWYYCNESGAMLANTKVDGYVLGASDWQSKEGNSSDVADKLNLVKSDKVANYNYYFYDAAQDGL